MTTVAGLAGSWGSADGTGSAARFGYVMNQPMLGSFMLGPAGVAVDSAGNVYVADWGNNNIRKIGPGGVVTTVVVLAESSGSMAGFNNPTGLAVDGAGNVYVTEYSNSTIRKLGVGGVVTTLAGLAANSGSADGTGSAARFNLPYGVAVDGAGSVYVADSGNHTIRKGWLAPPELPSITTGPVGQTVVQGGTAAFFVRATGFSLSYQWIKDGLALTGQTNANLVLTNVQAAQAGLYAVTVRNPAGTVTIPVVSLTVNSPTRPSITTAPASQTLLQGYTVTFQVTATGALLSYQWLKNGVILSGQTNASLNLSQAQTADAGNYTVTVSNGAGSVTSPVAVLTVLSPITITLQPWNGITWQTNVGACVVLTATVNATGPFSYQWSKNNTAMVGATNAALVLNQVQAADSGNYSVVVSNLFSYGSAVAGLLVGPPPAYTFVTLAGAAGVAGSADGTGSAAQFSGPVGVAVDRAGNVYVADSGNYTIRKITPAGVVSTLAGKAGSYGSTDGIGSAARFGNYWDHPVGLAVDNTGNVYVADGDNETIRKITPAGVVSTLTGQVGNQGNEDGPLSVARFMNPKGMAMDSFGSLYVAETSGARIRKITSDGQVTTLAGQGWGSADGIGSAALFLYPLSVGADGAGNVYVADCGNSTIRKITPAGFVSTLAGQSGLKGSTDGTGNAARFDNASSPSNSFSSYGLAVDNAGIVYVADSGNCTIRKITTEGVVRTLAGQAGYAGSADGTGSAARFNVPGGVAVDNAGNIYVADIDNHTIRMGWPTLSGPPTMFLSPVSQAVLAGTNVTFSVLANGTMPLSYISMVI